MSSLAARLHAIAMQAIGDCEARRLVEDALAGSGAIFRVVGAGKAVAAMASGAARALGAGYRGGALVAPHGLAGAGAEAEVAAQVAAALRLASHPVPDERGERATGELLACVAAAREPLLVLLSGGGSALLAATVEGVGLGELRRVTTALLASGEPTARVNTVRRHLGLALGGRLALARHAPAVPILALALSDVVGDDPADIASGPVSPDRSTCAEALDVLRAAGVADGPAAQVLASGAAETPKPGDPRLAGVEYRILASPVTLRARAAVRAAESGLRAIVDDQLVEGDVAEVARRYAARAPSLPPGSVLIAVGEPTVRLVPAPGRGGRSQQLALDVALRLDAAGGRDLAFLALGSDGADGPTGAAGAAIDLASVERTLLGSPAAHAALARNDAYPLLSRLGALLHTGATSTNLLDLHLLARAPR